MIITRCAACASPLAQNAPRCVRCHTRYCNATCQHAHWKDGHKKLCKKIARAGGAEPYHAGVKAKEAAAEAVAASAADTPKDASCHICRMTTGEGLVRACACHGATFETAGLAHVSCLVHQAQVAVDVDDTSGSGWEKWIQCTVCGQRFHGKVLLAM